MTETNSPQQGYMAQPMQTQPFQGNYSGQMGEMQAQQQQGTAYTLNGQVMQAAPPSGYVQNGQPMGQPIMYSGQPGQFSGQPVMYAQPVGMQPGMGQPMQMQGQMAIPVAGVYAQNPQQTSQGRWSDGICDCFQDIASCCWSFWFAPYRFAKTQSGAGLATFNSALWMYLIPWVIFVIFDFVGSPQITDCCTEWAQWVTLVAFLILVTIGTTYRIRLRQKFQIPGGEFEDFCCHLCCTCCAVAQEARHVDRALGLLH